MATHEALAMGLMSGIESEMASRVERQPRIGRGDALRAGERSSGIEFPRVLNVDHGTGRTEAEAPSSFGREDGAHAVAVHSRTVSRENYSTPQASLSASSLLCMLMIACTHHPANLQYAREHKCPVEQTKRQLRGDLDLVDGCGEAVEYQCGIGICKRVAVKNLSSPADANANPMDPRVASAVERWQREIVSPMCANEPAPPREHSVDVHGVLVDGQRCGLVSYEFGERAFYETFQGERCRDVARSECDSLYGAVFTARIHERYPRADRAWISNHCVGFIEDCDTFFEIELMHLRLHNEASLRLLDAELNAVVAEIEREKADKAALEREAIERERQERARRARAIGAALQEFGRSIQQRGVTCTTTSFGDTATTHCQ